MTYDFEKFQKDIHQLATEKGWWEGVDISDPHVLGTKLMLIVSELSEALEYVRGGNLGLEYRITDSKPCGFSSELADVVIQTMDLAEAMGIDLWGAMLRKHAFNMTREAKHGGKAL